MHRHDVTRRELLKRAAQLGGSAAAAWAFPPAIEGAFAFAQQTPSAANTLAATRAQMAATAIQQTALTNMMAMFSGPGGNVVVRNGEEGKVVVDTFV